MNNFFAVNRIKILLFFSFFLFIIGITLLTFKVFNYSNSIGWDFRVIWLSGKIWLINLNPYNINVFNQYNTFVPKGYEHLWAYPPNWSTISIPISYIPFPIAVIGWNIFSISMLCYGIYGIISCAYPKINKVETFSYFCLVSFLFFSSQSMAINISLGQTTILITAGILIYFCGLLADNRKKVILGAILLCLKPTLAIVILPSYLVLKRDLKTIFVIAIIVGSMALPAILLTSTNEIVTGFFSGLAEYGKFRVNTGAELTGLSHVIYIIMGKNISGVLITIIGGIFTIFTMAVLNEFKLIPKEDMYYNAFYCIIVLTLFFVPLHSYDWIVLLSLLTVFPKLDKYLKFFMGIAILITLRSGNLENVLGLSISPSNSFKDTTLLTMVSIFLVLGLGIFLFKGIKNNKLQ